MFKQEEPPIIMSIGGSLIVPNGGIDTDFLKKLNNLIREEVSKGKRFFLVTGGGVTSRHYRDAGIKIVGDLTDEDLDWLGIHSTRLNAHLLRTIFEDIAHPRIIENYERKLRNWKEAVVIGSGWKPGWSTDYDAVALARDYKASVIINLSNVDWIYDKDPFKFKDAKPIKKLTWEDYDMFVGQKWVPGLHAPFDPVAAQLAKKLGLTVIVTNGKKFNNLEKIINGEKFEGTVIMPFRIDASFYDREYYSGKKGEYRLGYVESFLGKIIHAMSNFYRAALIKIFLNPKNCLDVGCGTGRLVKFLRWFGIDAHGIEISQVALDLADPDTKPYLKKGDIIDIPYQSNRFDLVVTFDVMEHLEREKIEKAVSETIRVSSKFTLHKIYTQENLWIKLFHKHDFSHLSVFSKRRWQKIFSSFGNITILRRSFFKLPSFFETIFLLKKR